MDRKKQRSLIVEWLEARRLLASTPLISEFMADNEGTLLDGRGNASDWIEIFNPNDTAIDLAGYHLTDDPEELDRWKFPPVELPAGDHLVVFASGTGEVDPEGNLHTNFRLRRAGEYLALVDIDGQTIVQDFQDAFPPQRPDVSYGLQTERNVQTLVDSDSLSRIKVPQFFDDELGDQWKGAFENEPFDDSTWQIATASIGYDLLTADDDINIAPTGTASQSTTGFQSPADNAIDQRRNSFTHTQNAIDSWWRLELPKESNLGRIVIWNRADCCPERLSNFRVSVFDATDQEVYREEFYPSQQNSWPQAGESIEVDLPSETNGDTIQIQLLGQNNADNGWLSLAEVEVYERDGFAGLFSTDVSDSLKNENATALMRIPFEAPTIETHETLELAVRYDDGFVAFLNGQEIVRCNAPQLLTRFSTATQDQSRTDATTIERIDLSHWTGALRPGSNILAFQALNDAVVSNDFLLSPELSIVATTLTPDRFFSPSTPGAPNGKGVVGFLERPSFSVERGVFSEPIFLQMTAPTSSATLVYTIDGSEPSAINGVLIPPPNDAQPASVELRIDSTQTVRAAVIRDGYHSSPVSTHSYIMLDDVLTQPDNPTGFPRVWDGRSQSSIRADYEMDPEIVTDPVYGPEMIDGLTSIPSLSIVTSQDRLFGERGIYTNSGMRGRSWEYPTSVEIIETDGSHFQVDAGIRIHGFSWRFHSNTPKHSFRLEFRDEYGPTKLEYPMFPDAPVDRFDSIVLRAQGGRAWAGRQNPNQAQYIRDAFARDTARDMGKVDGHTAYFHLYLNGLYWGLYHAVERPDAQMAEEYFGGQDEDYDALNRRTTTNEAIDGDLERYNKMIALANRGVHTPADYQQMQRYVDLDNLIDFFLIHQYTTNRDGPEIFNSNNQRAIGSRIGDPKFRFFVWDMEYSMWNARDHINIDVDVPTSASRVYSALREYPEFRLRYADRVQKHLFHQGALTAEEAAARWQRRADEIYTAILGESARWGDAKRRRPYTRDNEWMRELNRLMQDYFPRRTGILLDQLREADLYPQLDAPSFTQQAGHIDAGFELTIEAPEGTVYYTTDGSDPRVPHLDEATDDPNFENGQPSDSAILSHDSAVIRLNQTTQIKARTYQDGTWSALNEATFFVGRPASDSNLRVTELHYHPRGNQATEFIELMNTAEVTISLAGVRLTEAVDFDFGPHSTHSLQPGERIVVVQNENAFRQRYHTTSIRIAGQFTSGRLANEGESLSVLAADGSLITQFTYDDALPWPPAADGRGPSLVLIDGENDTGTPNNWTHSDILGGTPGTGALPIGDSNRDGRFSSTDLVLAFQTNEYDDATPNNSTWEDGDWNSDGDFDSRDLVFAFQNSHYVAAALVASLVADRPQREHTPCDSSKSAYAMFWQRYGVDLAPDLLAAPAGESLAWQHSEF